MACGPTDGSFASFIVLEADSLKVLLYLLLGQCWMFNMDYMCTEFFKDEKEWGIVKTDLNFSVENFFF